MNNNTLTVRIAGRDYTLSSSDNDEWTLRVAHYVDEKISEVSLHTSMSPEISAVVAALSIAQDLFQLQAENQALRNRLYEAEKKEPVQHG